jgi:hypothetical protein
MYVLISCKHGKHEKYEKSEKKVCLATKGSSVAVANGVGAHPTRVLAGGRHSFA